MRDFATSVFAAVWLTHDEKDCALHFEDANDDANDDQDPRDDPDGNEDNHQDNRAHDTAAFGSAGLIAGPSNIPSLGAPTLPAQDRDMATETWRYLQSKMAKSKFKTGDFQRILAEFINHEDAPGLCIEIRREIDAMLHMYAPKDHSVSGDTDYGPANYDGTQSLLDAGDAFSSSEYSTMSPGLNVSMNVVPLKFREDDFVDVFEDFVSAGSDSGLKRRKRMLLR